jgi:hypothetical protein
MPIGNKTQRNFKKQMASVEKHMHQEAKKGKGVFANNLFRLRFYGYNGHEPEYKGLLGKFLYLIKWCINLIYKIIKYLIIIMGTIVFLFILHSLILNR